MEISSKCKKLLWPNLDLYYCYINNSLSFMYFNILQEKQFFEY